jgi:hypothetical protein|tara:strand:+ start:1367 stop:2872 length:1506 start_codon:yes stop_codon:yes gene_type:complete
VQINLNPKQIIAYHSHATEILYGGAAGGGKSLLLRISAVRWCEEVPGIQVYLFRRTYPELRENHLRGPFSFFTLLASGLDSGKVSYSKQENEFVWKDTNSRIVLSHCQYEDDVVKHLGSEIHVLLMDELTLFTEYQYRFLRSRVRLSGLDVPEKYQEYLPRIECGSNPGQIGHAFVKKAWRPNEKPYENRIWNAPRSEGGLKRQFIPAKLKDNTALLASDPTYEARLDGLGNETLVQAMKDGNWDIFAGQFFEKWNTEIHVLPEDFKIEPHWTQFGGYDDGYTHPYVSGAYAVDGDGNIIKFAEAGNTGCEPDQIKREIAEAYQDGLGFRGSKDKGVLSSLERQLADLEIYAGHDIFSKHNLQMKAYGREKAEQFRELGLTMLHADIDRRNGASWLRTLLDWRQDPDGKIVKKPKFYVKENCWRTIRTIPQMQINPNNPEDVLKVDATEHDAWAGDDAYDETRYACMSRWSPSQAKEQKPEWGTGGWFMEKLSRQGVDIDL